MKDETYRLIKEWFKTKTGITLMHDPSLVSLANDIEALRIHDVVGRGEQLTCPRCKSTNILNPDKDNDAQCIECAFIWAG